MSQPKVLSLLFGAVAGIAMGAVLIGLLLMAVAAAQDVRSGADAVLLQHPLFIAGSKLIAATLLACVPLVAIGYAQRKA